MNRDSRPHLRRAFGHLLGFGVLSFGLASWLTGCGSSSDGPSGCTTAADCAVGAECVNAACVSGAAGSSGMTGVAGAGVGGGALSGAAGFASSGAPGVAGAPGAAGASGSAGSFGGSAGQSGGGTGGVISGGGSSGRASNVAGGAGAGTAGSGGSMTVADVTGKCKEDYLPAANNGSVTRYDFSQGTSLPACSYVITHKGAGKDGDWDTVEGISTGDGGYFGAMNTADYNSGATCGACAEITYNGGTKVVITIVDECPVSSNSLCVKGHIDLSRKAIRQLQPNASLEKLGNGGNGSISWRYVTCPATGNVKMRLHPNATSGWQPVVIENGLYPLSKVTINGTNATRAGNNSGGNAWLATGAKLPYTVVATDVVGDAIQTNFAGAAGLTDVGKQFMCTK